MVIHPDPRFEPLDRPPPREQASAPRQEEDRRAGRATRWAVIGGFAAILGIALLAWWQR